MDTIILTPGEKIRAIRSVYNLKQQELCGSDLSRSMISMLESDKCVLAESTAKILINNLNKVCSDRGIDCGISLEYLLESVEIQAENIAKDFLSHIDRNPNKILDGDFQKSLREIIFILDKYNLKDCKAIIYKKLADYYKQNYDYSKAYSYYLSSFENHINLFNNINIIKLILCINYCCGKLNKYKELLEFNSLARIYMPNMPSNESFSISYNNILAYKKLKKYDQAICSIMKLEESFKDILDNNLVKKINLLVLKGNCYIELKSFAEALDIHREALELAKYNLELTLLPYLNIIDIYIKLNDKKNLKIALADCLPLVKEYDKFEFQNYLPSFYYHISEGLYLLKDYDESKVYLNLALSKSKKYKNISILEKSIDKLLSVYISENNKNEINSLKNEFLQLISTNLISSESLLTFKFIKYYIDINDCTSASHITNFIIWKNQSE